MGTYFLNYLAHCRFFWIQWPRSGCGNSLQMAVFLSPRDLRDIFDTRLAGGRSVVLIRYPIPLLRAARVSTIEERVRCSSNPHFPRWPRSFRPMASLPTRVGGMGERGCHRSHGPLDHRLVRLLDLPQPICRLRPDLRLGRRDRRTAHLVSARGVCRAFGRQLRDRTAAAPEQHPCGGMSWPLGAAPPLRGIGASRTGAQLQPAPTEGRFERDLVPTVLVPLVERLKRRTRDKDVLTLCEYVHGTIPRFRRTGDGTPPAVFPSALCPVCAARRAAETARKKRWRHGRRD